MLSVSLQPKQVGRFTLQANQSRARSASVRSSRTRSVVSAMTNMKGMPTLHSVWKVPKADEAKVDAIWKAHEEWMRATHTHGTAGSDEEKPRLPKFTISKGKELKDPMNPESGETGNLLYVMSEIYAAPEGIAGHFKIGEGLEMMANIMDGIGKYGYFMEVGTCQVIACMEDEAKPLATPAGHPTLHVVYKAPKSEEATYDAMFKSHEEFMRRTHTMNPAGKDEDAPRMSSYYVAKGQELNDPMNPESGATGKVLYIISETYYAPTGIAGHFKQAESWPLFSQLMEKNAADSYFIEMSCQVFTTFG